MKYRGYEIRSCGEYYEILNKGGKFLRNALSVTIAKGYIDLIENARY